MTDNMIFNLFQDMKENNILVSFKGEISSELLSATFQIVESKLEKFDEAIKTKRRVINVVIESLQNLYHHIGSAQDSDTKGLIQDTSAIFVISRQEGVYKISTGNFLLTSRIAPLKIHLEKINRLNREELRAFHNEVLSTGEFTDKGGGGLGLIDLAKKSKNQLVFDFIKCDEEVSFFVLEVSVDSEK